MSGSGISASPQTTRAAGHLSFSHTPSSFPSPLPCPQWKVGFFFPLLYLLTTPIRCPLKQNPCPPALQNYVAGTNTSPPTPTRWTSDPSLTTWTPVTVNTPVPVGRPPPGNNWPLLGKSPETGKKEYKVHTTVLKKIITDFYSTYRKKLPRGRQRMLIQHHIFFIFILYIFYSLFFYRSEQILEASYLTVAPPLCHWTSPSAPNPSKRPLPFLQYSKQILTTTTTITITSPKPR